VSYISEIEILILVPSLDPALEMLEFPSSLSIFESTDEIVDPKESSCTAWTGS